MTPTNAPDLPDLKWTKKPVTIEAWQLTEEVALNYWENKVLPPFGCKSISGDYNKNTKVVSDAYFFFDTLEGSMKASLGDWIIKGVKGEIYPCRPDIFEATYTRPKSEASALATPVGWRPPSSDPSAIQVHVVSYDSEKHQLNCRFPDGIVREVDPFVGCAIECTDDDYVEKGEACVGKDFIMSGSWRHGPYLCHRFDEIPAPPHTEERG